MDLGRIPGCGGHVGDPPVDRRPPHHARSRHGDASVRDAGGHREQVLGGGAAWRGARHPLGKIGTAGQAQDKSFADEAAATRELAKLVAEKLKKGYAEVTGAAPEVAADSLRRADPPPTHAPRITPPAARPADAPGFAIRKAFDTGAVIAGGRVAWADTDQSSRVHVHALDGAHLWAVEVDGSPRAVHADDRSFVVRSAMPEGDATRLTWLDARTGALEGTVDLEPSADSVLVGGVVVVLLAEEVFREGDREGAALLDRLLATSVDPGTPSGELVTMLEARGAGPAEARALVDWLG